MARKRKHGLNAEEKKDASSYYRLNTKAVDDLVNANEENSPPVSEAEINAYRGRLGRIHLSETAKALLIKVWFAGSVCFFIYWGLASIVADILDLLVVFGIVLGIVTDLLTNNALRFFAKTEGSNDIWMMFPQKKFFTFFLNILYALLLLFFVVHWYGILNLLLSALSSNGGSAVLGVEPILFGIFYTAFDVLFVRMRILLRDIIRDSREAVRMKQ